MTAAPLPQIDDCVPLPLNIALSPDLYPDPTNWRWVHCLTLPLRTLNPLQFSPRPYKWVRYAIGVIVEAEGSLSTSRDSVDVVDYNVALPGGSAVLYYYLSNEERRRMFPANPNIGRTDVTSSAPTTRRAEFRDEVAERDGRKNNI